VVLIVYTKHRRMRENLD